jgi:hypothetical protein
VAGSIDQLQEFVMAKKMQAAVVEQFGEPLVHANGTYLFPILARFWSRQKPAEAVTPTCMLRMVAVEADSSLY